MELRPPSKADCILLPQISPPKINFSVLREKEAARWCVRKALHVNNLILALKKIIIKKKVIDKYRLKTLLLS